jgi:hypothetical protein
VRYSRPLPNRDLLSQLRSYLIRNQLTEVVTIQAEDSRQDSVEYLLPDNEGMVCIPRKEGDSDVRQSVITGWKFYEMPDSSIQCVKRRGCALQGDRQH